MERKKNITKEQIISTALDLIRDKNELRTVNMREVARTLGCAHTNIYNYFPTYTDLLWETHTAILVAFMRTSGEKLSAATTAEMQLQYFFDTFAQMYLENKGWFRLVWLEYIGDDRPKKNWETTEKVRLELNHIITNIWRELKGFAPKAEIVNRVVHNTHCYIIGEVSNYISGRGLIENEAELREYIVKESINICTCCMKKE